MDPYRDSNLQNRVGNLEERVTDLEENSKGQRNVVFRAIGESLAENFKDGTIWFGVPLLAIIITSIVMIPSCIQSMSDSPEDVRAEAEAEQQTRQNRQEACEALGMHFVSYAYDRSGNTYRLTCASETEVTSVNVATGETVTHRIHAE